MESHRFKRSLTTWLMATLITACSAEGMEESLPEDPLDGTPRGFIAQGVGTPALARWFTFAGQDHIAQVELTNNQNGSLALFERTRTGELRYAQQTAPNSGWTPVVSLGGADIRDFAVAENADGRLEVFVLLNSGSIYYRSQSAPNSTAWNNWYYAAGVDLQDLTVGRNPDGRLQLFVVGGDQRIYERHQLTPGGALSDWSLLGGTSFIRAKVESNADGRLALFTLSNTGELFVNEQLSPNGPFIGWVSLAGAQAGDLEVVRGLDGRLEVVVNVPNTGLYHRAQTAPNGPWGNWSYLGAHLTRGSFDLVPGPNGSLHVFASYGNPRALYYGTRSGPTAAFTWQGVMAGDRAGLSAARNLDGRLELFSFESESSPRSGRLFQTWQTQPGGAWLSPPPPRPSFGTLSSSPSTKYYGDVVTVNFSASSAGCSFLTMTLASTPTNQYGSATGPTTQVYSRSVSGESLADTYSFTLRNNVRVDFTATCDDNPEQVAATYIAVTGTTRPPAQYQGTYRLYMGADPVSQGPLTFSATFGYGINGSARSLYNPLRPFGNYTLSLIPPGASNYTCWTSGSVLLAPGATTRSGDLTKLYGTETPGFPLIVRACAGTPDTGVPLDQYSIAETDITYIYYQ